MIIRKLLSEDIDLHVVEIRELFELALRSSFESNQINDEVVSNKIQDFRKYICDETAIAIGAFEKELLIGFVWSYELRRMEKRLHIDYIAVLPDFQRRGIACQLLDEVMVEAIKRKIYEIDLWVTASNHVAFSFYKTEGFDVERFQLRKVIRDADILRLERYNV